MVDFENLENDTIFNLVAYIYLESSNHTQKILNLSTIPLTAPKHIMFLPIIFTSVLLLLLPLYLLLSPSKPSSKRLPPGSLGLPIIGQSPGFLRALRGNRAEEWLKRRVAKYGPISKMHILGLPTVFLHGQAANKFIYTCDGGLLSSQQPQSIRMLCGERSIVELSGSDHKRVRGALVSFLKPEALKEFVWKMDEEVREHLKRHWHGKHKVSAVPLVKNLTFNIMCSLIVGIKEESERERFIELFQQLMKGLLSVPINLPFTRLNRSLSASAKIRNILMELIREKRQAMSMEESRTDDSLPKQDLLASLISLKNDQDEGRSSPLLTDDEIVDSVIIVMIGGHDTTSSLLALLIKHLAGNPSIYSAVVEEQEEIARAKGPEEHLKWEDLAKMRYTWKVASECLRVTPPFFCSFRKAAQDFEYEGYLIPKGWQVVWAGCMTHMDANIFPNPSAFDPSHFDNRSSIPPYSFIPFGGGPRMCPGNEFSRIDTLVAMHYLVTQFKWRQQNPDVPLSIDPLPTFKDGLEILLESKVIS